eukprot:1085811-Rhodomonas_salina.1
MMPGIERVGLIQGITFCFLFGLHRRLLAAGDGGASVSPSGCAQGDWRHHPEGPAAVHQDSVEQGTAPFPVIHSQAQNAYPAS